MDINDIKKGLLRQSDICGVTSPLYRDILKYSSENELICNMIFNSSQSREFTGSLEISLTFISYFNFISLNGHYFLKYFKSYGGNYSQNKYNNLTIDLENICIENRLEIEKWIESIILQTNEIARCAVIYPALLSLGLENINLIELGSSAGLILYMDKYSYKYTNGDSFLTIENDKPLLESKINYIEKLNKLIINKHKLKINKRLGFDLNPMDLSKDENINILKSAIWDSPERLSRLEKAIGTFKSNQVSNPVINQFADYTKDLSEKVLNNINEDDDIVLYTSVSTYQISDELYDKLILQIKNIAKQINSKVYFIEFEPPRKTENLGISNDSNESFILKITDIKNNESRIFAKSHFHGLSVSLI